ncbi:MAG TPA: glutaredoxin family protein [Thermoanaerobaculia bacterium]
MLRDPKGARRLEDLRSLKGLECRLYVNSAQAGGMPAGAGVERGDPPAAPTVDVAVYLAAAHQLIRLGISPRHDLPAVLLSEPGGRIRVAALRLAPEEVAKLCAGQGIPAARLVVYSSAWCPDCRRAKRVLEEASARFEEVDIDSNPGAEAAVLERSGGRRVVPTLLFDDRLWAFNPDPPLLRRLVARAARA